MFNFGLLPGKMPFNIPNLSRNNRVFGANRLAQNFFRDYFDHQLSLLSVFSWTNSKNVHLCVLMYKNFYFSRFRMTIRVMKKTKVLLEKPFPLKVIIEWWWTFSTIILNFQKTITKQKAKDGRWMCLMSMPKGENSSKKPLKICEH